MATSQLKSNVTSILKEPLLRRVQFSMQGAPVDGFAFEKIADLVQRGKIGIDVDTNGDAEEFKYGGATDLTGSRFIFTTDYPTPLTIVHEGAHAILYYRKCFAASEVTMEAAAYIAEVLYSLLKHGKEVRERLSQPSQTHLGYIYHEALKLIDKYELMTKSSTLLSSDYQELRLAISTHPTYKDAGLY